MRASFLVFLALMNMANHVLSTTDLFFLSASLHHGPDDGIPPLTAAELVERAHEKALASYQGEGAIQQVSRWNDVVRCTPVYRGSPLCYEATIYSRASFVQKEYVADDWQVRVNGTSLAHQTRTGKCTQQNWNEAQQNALKEAEFACHGDVVNKPSKVTQTAERFLDTWYDECTYTATFSCQR